MPTAGTKNEKKWTVRPEHLASSFGSGLADVLATPVLVGFCEDCARTSVDGSLPLGQQTVGTRVEIEHLAATPPGMTVTVRTTLLEVAGRRLRFRLEVEDELDTVARGIHDRFIVDSDRFGRGVAEKTARWRGTSGSAAPEL